MAWSRPLRVVFMFLASVAVCSSAVAETVLLEFTSDGCAPCVAMGPIVRQLAAQRYAVREVNISRDPAAAANYNVTLTPTFLVMVDGQEWARLEGRSNYPQLVEMIHKATELAAARQGAVTTIDMQSSPGRADRSGGAFASGPAPGRVVQIGDPLAASAPAGPQADAGRAPPKASVAQSSAVTLPADQAAALIAATVRLSIEDPDGRSTGTGVIVDAREGEALVLTCGHLFRASQGKGRIEITRFAAAGGGAQVVETAVGVLMHYDLNRDLALVRFSPSTVPGVAPVAPLGTPLEPGASVTSVGCNHGENPTAWATQITAINRYAGFPNIEAGGAPVEGRSGGGLFNEQGYLIGICFAADPRDDEGLYASLTSIQGKLDELQLSMVYQAPSRGQPSEWANAPATAVAASGAPQPFAVRGQDPAAAAPTPNQLADWPAAPSPVAAPAPQPQAQASAPPAQLTAEEQAALDEIKRRGVNAEVICIIRPLSPDGRSDVIKLNNMSPAFVAELARQAAASADGAPLSGAAAGGAALR